MLEVELHNLTPISKSTVNTSFRHGRFPRLMRPMLSFPNFTSNRFNERTWTAYKHRHRHHNRRDEKYCDSWWHQLARCSDVLTPMSSRKLPREMSSRLIQFHNKGLEMDTLTALKGSGVDNGSKSRRWSNEKRCRGKQKTMRTFLAVPCPFWTYDTIVESSGAQILDADWSLC